jgi:sulfate transport system permease protein
LLALLALVTLLIKQLVEWQHEREIKTLSNLPPEHTANLKAAS